MLSGTVSGAELRNSTCKTIDLQDFRISRCDGGRRRHLRHGCLFGVVDKSEAAMVLDPLKASCTIFASATQDDAHDAPAEDCRGWRKKRINSWTGVMDL